MLRRAGIALAALSTAIAAGFSASSVGARVSNPSGLCGHVGSVERASVTRVNTLHNRYAPFSFPAQVQITSPARARALASAICRLPRYPGGLFCPADFGLRYAVRFNGQEGPVSIDPSGCETVTGAGPVRWVARTPRFWQEFGRVLGIKGATRATFAGSLPNR